MSDDWKKWANLALKGANVAMDIKREKDRRLREAAQAAAKSAAERRAAEQAAVQAAAEEKARQQLTWQARQLEGQWVSQEQKLECEITQPDLTEPSIVLQIEDTRGRIRAVAPVSLKALVIGGIAIPQPHAFVAVTGPDLKMSQGSELSGELEISPDCNVVTLVLYQAQKSANDPRKEGLRATFLPKRPI